MRLGYSSLLVAAPLVCLMSAPALAMVKTIVTPFLNESNLLSPYAAFTPGEPLPGIVGKYLVETASACGSVGNCTYDFTFSLAGVSLGDTEAVQLQAVALLGKPLTSTHESLDFSLYSGAPGSGAHIADSSPAGNFAETIVADLTDGSYYVQVLGSAVAVSGETGSGSLTVSAVPETSTWLMTLAGFAGIGFAGYRRGKSKGRVAGRGRFEARLSF